MAVSDTMLKNTGDRVSLCLSSVLTSNSSNVCLLNLTLQLVLSLFILIIFTVFAGVSKYISVPQNVSLYTESCVCL